jgi:adenylate cyclase
MVVYANVWIIVLVFLLLPFVIIFASWYLMAAHGILLDVWTFAFVAGVSSLIGGSIYRYFVVDASRRFLSKAFGHYISPDIVKQIAANPESLSLGGQRRDLTVFFSDIAGFSGISEILDTDGLFKLMNEYLSEMTEILVRNNGTLDKYIGDSVMGFYGAPLPLERGSYWACKTALEQQERLVTLNKKWSANKIPPIRTRIGIHSGEVMVGNIGSSDRFNYTVMGDNVNLASRLEGVNKEYETLVCVSAHVAAEAGNKDFVFRRLDRIRVKGKEESVEIFELVGFVHNRSKAMEEKLLRVAAYEKALEHYFSGDFAMARELFRQYPDDPPAAIL